MSESEPPVATEMATRRASPRRRDYGDDLARAAAGRALLEDPRLRDSPLALYTYAEVAKICHRSESTIKSLVSRYRLPKVNGWRSYPNRTRRRVTFFDRKVVALLQQITLLGPSRAEKKRGQVLGLMIDRGMLR
jgi:hypothetical protein